MKFGIVVAVITAICCFTPIRASSRLPPGGGPARYRSRERSESGYRQFPPEAVNRLRFIAHAKRLGFSLREIGELLSLRVDIASAAGGAGLPQTRARRTGRRGTIFWTSLWRRR
ncbi:MAG: MerR family DNA-binding protein [Spirochaetes bacterium]|nr:MerR family DNA-binding protein [Spirochaetota bacterium]